MKETKINNSILRNSYDTEVDEILNFEIKRMIIRMKNKINEDMNNT
jgi:hypothetical protein